MRRYLLMAGLLLASAAQAGGGTLRVGNQVLAPGDSAARVIELLGKPAYKTHSKTPSGQRKARGRKTRGRGTAEASGEQWQYREGGRTITIYMVGGKVNAIHAGGR